MLAYYMDHNIPAALTRGLRQRGVDVLTAFEDHRDREKVPPLFERAHALQRVFVTFDDDFLRIAAEWQKDQPRLHGADVRSPAAFQRRRRH